VTLSYGKIKLNKKEKKRYFIILISFIILTLGTVGFNTLIGKGSSDINKSTDLVLIYQGEPNIAKGIPDGSYTGSSKGFKGTTVVKVIVENETLTDIEIVSYDDDERWFERAKNSIINSIIQNQNTDVDTVAGATYSSVGIKNSIINALKNTK